MKVIWLTLLLGLSAFRAEVHPMHISVTEIDFDEKDKALEITMRIFADDLETCLRKSTGVSNLDILNPGTKSIDDLMKQYLAGKFEVRLDGKIQKHNYLGNEKDGDAFIFYIEVPQVKKWKAIAITNSMLTEVFEDQSNLVHVTVRGEVQSLRLMRGSISGNLQFNVK